MPIDIGTFGLSQTLTVIVHSMNSQSMTLTTTPGHLLYPAQITFAASRSPASPSAINFNIDVAGKVGNGFEFSMGGSGFEDAQWNNFLGQVVGFCKAGR